MEVFLTKNWSRILRNHDLKTFFVLDAFADLFCNNFGRFLLIFGPSEPLKSSKSHGRYCIFAKIAFFTPRGVPRAIVDDSS